MNSHISSTESMQPIFDAIKGNNIPFNDELLCQLADYLEHQSQFLGSQKGIMSAPSPTRTLAELTTRAELISVVTTLFDAEAAARLVHLSVNEYWLLRLSASAIFMAVATHQDLSQPFTATTVTLGLAEIWLCVAPDLRQLVASGSINDLSEMERKAADKAGLIVIDNVDPEGDQDYVNPIFLPDSQVEYRFRTLNLFVLLRPIMDKGYKLTGNDAIAFMHQLMSLQVDGGSDPFNAPGVDPIQLVCERENNSPVVYTITAIGGGAPFFAPAASTHSGHGSIVRYNIQVETKENGEGYANEVELEINVNKSKSDDGKVVSFVLIPATAVPEVHRLLKVRNPGWWN